MRSKSLTLTNSKERMKEHCGVDSKREMTPLRDGPGNIYDYEDPLDDAGYVSGLAVRPRIYATTLPEDIDEGVAENVLERLEKEVRIGLNGIGPSEVAIYVRKGLMKLFLRRMWMKR
jgi:hypothetical protein